jgi:predicted nucleotidyltransferase component of viral defense system
MIAPTYRAQVALLLRILPEVAKEKAFALKGGTAINLFVRDMPRFSVDVDLTYIHLNDRATALREISEGLHRLKERLDQTIPGIRTRVVIQSGGQEAKLTASLDAAAVMIEVNMVIRGSVWPVRDLTLAPSAQKEFNTFVVAPAISEAELYGGKLCAALDRQHPRDLFDVQHLLDHGGITDEIRQGFLVSLMGHTRPMNELLKPQFKDRQEAFARQFQGMTIAPYSYSDFEATRDRLVREVREGLQDSERELLLSLKRCDPKWDLFPVAGIQDLPAIQWKLSNLHTLSKNARKHAEQLKALEEALSTK